MADGGDYDDWFDEPEPPQQPRRRGQRRSQDEPETGDDPWVTLDTDEERVRPRRRPPQRQREPLVIGGREVTQTQAAIVAASAIVVLLAILAAAGVFSGGSGTNPGTVAPPTTTPPAVTPTETTPATKPTTVQAPTTSLKPGDTGAQVVRLQRALTSLGYSPGKADGSYGPATKKAVVDFQTAQGLTADGIVGPKTLAALQSALASG